MFHVKHFDDNLMLDILNLELIHRKNRGFFPSLTSGGKRACCEVAVAGIRLLMFLSSAEAPFRRLSWWLRLLYARGGRL
jgi:hypothetical protein